MNRTLQNTMRKLLYFDAFLSAMYALSVSAEGDCYRCVPPDPGIAAAALGASESGTLLGTAPTQALHTFTLDSGASACLHLPSFSTNLVSTAALQDAMDTTTTPGGQRVSICTCIWTGRHLATFTRRPRLSLYTLASEPPQTLLWHHRLGHPSRPRLRGMHSRLLVFGLPRSLPPLPTSPAPPYLPYVEGRQRAAPHSSSFPPTSAPPQTLHIDAREQGRKRYFLLVVDDYTRYTTIFPLRSKGQVVDFLIPWIRTVRLQLRERFGHDLPVLRLHSDRGGEFSFDLLRDFCHGEVILHSFTLPDSPQQDGIAENRIGLVMEVARTSMIHAAAPHFLWLFATFPTLRWMGEVGDASVFRVWGSRAFVHDMSADKLSPRAIPCVFLGFVPDAPGWQFYDPTLRRIFPSQDVTFDESVPFYYLFPYRSAPPPPSPLFLAPGPPPVDPLPPQGPAPSGVSQVDPLPGPALVQVAVGSGAARGAASGGAEPGGAESEGAGSGGAELECQEPGGAEPGGAALSGGSAGALPPLSPQQQREWFVRRARLWSGAIGAGGAGGTAGASGTRGVAATGPGGARTRGTGAARAGGVEGTGAGDLTELGAAGAGGTGAGGAGAGGAGHVLGVPSSPSLTPPLLCLPPDQSQLPLQPASPLPAPSPYTEQSGGLTERHKPSSRPVSPIRTARRVPRSRPPPVPGTHAMALRPSSVPLRVPLPAPPESSLPEVSDPEFDRSLAANPSVSRLLVTAVTDPSFESATASALVAELVDLATACHLDYATALVAEFESASFPSIGDSDASDIPTPRSYAEAIMGPYYSLWQAAMDAKMASWNSRGTYVDEVPPPRANIVDGMWIFKRDYELHSLDFSTVILQGSLHEEIWLRRPPDFTNSFPAGTQWSLRRPVHGLRQAPREWHDTLRTTLAALGFAPSTADPSLFLRTDTPLPPFYVLVYVNDIVFATAATEALTLVKKELQKRHICTDLGELHSYLGLQTTRDRARRTITLTQSHMVHQVLQRFSFEFSSPLPTPLSTNHSLSAPPSDEFVGPSGLYPELVGCLMCYVMLSFAFTSVCLPSYVRVLHAWCERV
ncbi:unnamed protein product [Closterium sp. NIES-54]